MMAPPAFSVPVPTSGSDKLGKVMATRPLGNTGESLTLLGLGGFHFARGDSEKVSAEIIEVCLENGVRFFDNAPKYHNGKSEILFGKYLTPRYRDHVYIMSKCDLREPEIPSAQQLETSLRRMKTDYLDMWLVHAIDSVEDADRRIKEMLETAYKAREEGKIRHFGFSGHRILESHLHGIKIMQGHPLDAVLLPISPMDYIDDESYTREVMPKLLERGAGVLAMKTMNFGSAFRDINGKRLIPDHISIEENQWFTLSLPITSWVSGMETVEEARQNISIAQRFTRLSEDDRLALADRVLAMKDVPRQSIQPYRAWTR